ISPAVMQALCRYAWPGNVRELENVIERAVIVAKGDTIADVERFLTGEAERPRVDLGLPFRDAKARVIEEFERAYIVGVLEAEGGKLTAAAKHADMDPKNFYEKLTRYGLRRPAVGLGDCGRIVGGRGHTSSPRGGLWPQRIRKQTVRT